MTITSLRHLAVGEPLAVAKGDEELVLRSEPLDRAVDDDVGLAAGGDGLRGRAGEVGELGQGERVHPFEAARYLT